MSEARFRIYVCGNIHCAATGRDRLIRELDDALWAAKLDGEVEVRTSGCQNQCDYAPNIKIWPGPFQYSRLTPEAIRRIVEQHLVRGQPVTELLNETIAGR